MLSIRRHQSNTQVSSFCLNLRLNLSCHIQSILYIKFYIIYFISDLPKDSRIFDVDEVINLDPTKLKAEETGERIVHRIQEWLISETSARERAALPEEVTPHLLVGISKILLSFQRGTTCSPIPYRFTIPFHLF